MPKFRKKPVEIEAMQFPADPDTHALSGEVEAFDAWLLRNQGDHICRYEGKALIIPTLEGEMTANPGDWIIRGIRGELYPCKPDIFAATYEPA